MESLEQCKDLSKHAAACKYVDLVQSLAPDGTRLRKTASSRARSSSESSSSPPIRSRIRKNNQNKSQLRKKNNLKSSLKRVGSGDFSRITSAFNQACSHFMSQLQHACSDGDKLVMYGLFKQSRAGTNNTPKPSMMSGMEKSKWNYWNKFKGMSKIEARSRCVNDSACRSELKPTTLPLEEEVEGESYPKRSPRPTLDNDTALKFKEACAYVVSSLIIAIKQLDYSNTNTRKQVRLRDSVTAGPQGHRSRCQTHKSLLSKPTPTTDTLHPSTQRKNKKLLSEEEKAQLVKGNEKALKYKKKLEKAESTLRKR